MEQEIRDSTHHQRFRRGIVCFTRLPCRCRLSLSSIGWLFWSDVSPLPREPVLASLDSLLNHRTLRCNLPHDTFSIAVLPGNSGKRGGLYPWANPRAQPYTPTPEHQTPHQVAAEGAVMQDASSPTQLARRPRKIQYIRTLVLCA